MTLQSSGKPLTDSRLANLGAQTIVTAFEDYQANFLAITLLAQKRFVERDWQASQYGDVGKRLTLYKESLNRAIKDVRELLSERITDRLIWISLKAAYSGLIETRQDWELAETFFNSITRRIFTTVGLDAQIEFADTDFDQPPHQPEEPVYNIYPGRDPLALVFEQILSDFRFTAPYADIYRDVLSVTGEIERRLSGLGQTPTVNRIEMLCSVFYRGKSAYLVGRLYTGEQAQPLPLVLALLNTAQGVVVNAVLMTEKDVDGLFSLSRAYFRVALPRPYEVVRFLKTVMPRRPLSKLYTALGYDRHGKTQSYRELIHHLQTCQERFEVARGIAGMVMIVFSLPSYPAVFKVIRDHFAYPKTVTRQVVLDRYKMVYRHDRAGRLVDAHEFEFLKIEKQLFTPELLEQLALATQSVIIEEEYVILKHVYVEQKVTPLNLYLQEASPTEAGQAVVECGNAIKDLAATNIFTGDMLLKNFGVTRHGRVVFYDYDELCFVTDCNFREMPDNDDDELAAEPSFGVGENDVFPEEFPRFLAMSSLLKEVFMSYHADLCTARWWREMQARLEHGEVIDVFPYDPNRNLLDFTRSEFYYAGASSYGR